MDNNKINVEVLEKNYNDFHYERTIFESVTYDTFKTSYFRSCDDELVEQMATKLNDCYSAIERNYNSTVEWWKNYLYDVKCAENGICMDSNAISTHESSINSYFTSNLQPLPKFDKNKYSMASISANNTASSNVSFSGGLGGTAISAKNPTNNNSNKTLDKSMLNTKILTKDELKQQYSNYYNEAKQMLIGTEYENIDDETLTKVMPAYAMYVKNKQQLEKEGYTMKGLLKGAINQQIQGEDTVAIAKELLSDLNLSAGEWFGKVLSDTGAQAVGTTTSAAMSFTEGVIDLGESLGDFTISRVTSMWTNGNNFRGDLFSTAKHFVKTGDFKQLGIDMTHNGSEFVRSIDFFGLSDLAYSLAKKTSVGKYIDENSTKNEKVHNNSNKVTGITKNIVAKDYTKSFFDSVYEKTAFGKWVKDNSLGFDTVRNVGNMTGKVAGIIAISALIPGGGAIVRPLLAGMSGYGEGAQESFANGSSFEDGLAYGFSKGSWEGLQWFIGEKIGGSSIFKNKAANSLFRIAMDGADSAADSIINPLLDINKEYTDEQKEQILMLVNYDKNGNQINNKTWEELSAKEKYEALFEYNGGVNGLIINTLMGAGMSAFGEVTDLAKKVDGTTKTNTDINLGKNIDGEVNADSLIQSKLNRYKELSDIINSDDYKQYMDYTKKGYAQKLNASYDGIEKEFRSLQEDLNLLNISKSGGFNMNDLSYKSSSSSDYTKDYLKSNLKKYVYSDTNNFDGLNDSIKMNGLYHFTSEDAADAILESGFIKSSGVLSSYGNKKTFFFNGVPEIGAFATNIDDIPLKTTAIKVEPNISVIESSKLKIRNLDDHAISWDGKFDLSNSSKTSKEYFCLVKENDKLVYKRVSKDVYDNYDTTDMAKSLKELLSDKKNISTIKADYLSKLSNNNTESLSKIKNKIGNNTVDKIKANTDKLIEKNNIGSDITAPLDINSIKNKLEEINSAKMEFNAIEMKNDILNSIDSNMNDIQRARKAYIELNNRLHYSMDYVKGNDEIRKSIYTKELDFNNLNSDNVICKGWSELYRDVLIDSGFDADKVRIVGGTNVGAHKWIEVDIGNNQILVADATEAINHSIDLSNCKSGMKTNGFVILSKEMSGQALSSFNADYSSWNQYLKNVDKSIGYATDNGYYADILEKSKNKFSDNNLAKRIFGDKIFDKKYDQLINIEIPTNMDGYETYAYFNQVERILFDSQEQGNISVKLLYIQNSTGKEGVTFISSTSDINKKYMIYSKTTGKLIFNTLEEVSDYMRKFNITR